MIELRCQNETLYPPSKQINSLQPYHQEKKKVFQLQKGRERGREKRRRIENLSESLAEEEEGLQAAGW